MTEALLKACHRNGLIAENGEPDVQRTIENGINFGRNKLFEEDFPPARFSDEPALAIRATPFVACNPVNLPQREWLYDRHYIRKFATAIIAGGGVGKSALKVTEAISMAIGRDLLDSNKATLRRYKVWYWNGEDPLDEIRRRIAAVCQHHDDVDPKELEGWLFVNSGHEMPICLAVENHGKVEFDDQAGREISDTIEDNKIDVLILDPFIALHKVSESNNPLIDQVVKKLAKIANQRNCSIEIVHHIRKPSAGQHDVTADDSRGGGAIINAVRSCKVLNRMGPTEAQRAGVEDDKRYLYIRVDSGKQNLAPPEKAKWRRLVSVSLPNGDSVQAVEFWQFPEATQWLTSEDEEFIRSAARTGEYRWDSRATNWFGKVVATHLGLDVDDRAEKEDMKAILTTCRQRKIIAVERRADAQRRPREFVVVGGKNRPD